MDQAKQAINAVKVYKNGGVSRQEYEAIYKRAIEAETKLEKAKSILV